MAADVKRNLPAKAQNLVKVVVECLSEGGSPSELLRRALASVVGRSAHSEGMLHAN